MSESTRLCRIAALACAAILLAPPVCSKAQTPAPATIANRHPLDPLDPAEIEAAAAAVRKDGRFKETVRFVAISPNEPPKEAVRRWKPGDGDPDAPAREAFLILLDGANGRGYEAVVDLASGGVRRYDALPEGVQPPIMSVEFGEVAEAVRKAPAFREAMKKRGIEDLSLVMVDAWTAGHYGNEPPEDRGKRLVRALCWVRANPTDNGFAHPIENIVAVVDLNRKELLRLEDHGVVPVPARPGHWARAFHKETRAGLKPLEVLQPEGPSFEVKGYEVAWQKWTFRVGFNPREGLVLHTIAFDGRPVLYRASIAEMIVPYADPKASSYHKNVFDLGEYGLGMSANSLEIGCDCLGTIRYFDGHLADNGGRVVTIKNAICLHEEDAGMLWKHTDHGANQSEVRRSRRLAVSTVSTLGNYDYGFSWYLYQDGSIAMEVKLTGIMNTTALLPGESPRHGVEVAPGLNAPYHQHYFSARLDVAVDGEENAIEEVNVRGLQPGPDDPHGGGFVAEATPLRRESEAQRNTEAASARFWRVTNPGRTNGMGRPVAYRLCPGETTRPFARPDASVLKRAAFVTRTLWVTPFDPAERFPAGDYPNQHPGGDGLPRWTRADRDLTGRDLVLWYTFGQTHIPRLEDWPVMPATSVGFMLRPDGFFDRNPALDLPPPR
jgi:primary-amine oxidase